MSLDLFEFAEKEKSPGTLRPTGPLAHRMRPRTLDEFVGQEKSLGPKKPLRLWIEADRVPSLILWGPPGSGKTTLAQIIASHTQSHFESISAVLTGVKGIKEAIERAHHFWDTSKRRTILFVDEIHRFNKAQQDALLPHVEAGTVTLIGATTENPSFELNRALLSRSRVIRLESLSSDALSEIIRKALQDPERGLGGFLSLSDDAVSWIAESSEGDARKALTTLENIALVAPSQSQPMGATEVQNTLEAAHHRQPVAYDKAGEEHYNVISAFIKSIRDSDPHAGLYYLARMIEGGEDPLFIARRLVILASEDIGNADPRALSIALAVKDAVDFVGMPEARINLAQAVTYLALAPKSNASYEGIEAALQDVQEKGALPVPFHLRNAVTSLMKSEGYSAGYQYAHHSVKQHVKQKHLPEPLIGRRYYKPKDMGLEKLLKQKLENIEPDFE